MFYLPHPLGNNCCLSELEIKYSGCWSHPSSGHSGKASTALEAEPCASQAWVLVLAPPRLRVMPGLIEALRPLFPQHWAWCFSQAVSCISLPTCASVYVKCTCKIWCWEPNKMASKRTLSSQESQVTNTKPCLQGDGAWRCAAQPRGGVFCTWALSPFLEPPLQCPKGKGREEHPVSSQVGLFKSWMVPAFV